MDDEAFYARLERMRHSPNDAERLTAKIWADVTGRRSWRQAADQFDAETKGEIIDRWLEIIRSK